ncbi:olfactory receptor class A-like protein 1 [Protopterus annectens]|uniref:olfactory receptor class A-like protein 1 n=1 Tax=Protopterus annectens TaxID=7888 RepID=UPI001CF9B836|nr:olfactory receptor class A-like protein 1 [Protopterus annectens]
MEAYAITKGVLFLVVAVIGIPGNLAIIGSFSWIALSTFKLLPVEIIIFHLALANALLVFTRGLPAALFILFGTRLNNETGCSIVIYVARISRGMAIGLTCVLSCVQLVTLIPASSKWVYLKLKVPKYIFAATLSLWPLYMIMEISGLIFSGSEMTSSNPELIFNFGYCLTIFPTVTIFNINGFFYFSRDLMIVSLMSLSSVCILLILYRHRKQVNDVRTSNQNSAVEIRAAKTVVSLVTMYVLFFGVENTIWLYQISVSKFIHPVVSDVRHFFSDLLIISLSHTGNIVSSCARVKLELVCIIRGEIDKMTGGRSFTKDLLSVLLESGPRSSA